MQFSNFICKDICLHVLDVFNRTALINMLVTCSLYILFEYCKTIDFYKGRLIKCLFYKDIDTLSIFIIYLLISHLDPVYPGTQPRHVPSTMLQWLSWQFCGHGKEQFSPWYPFKGHPVYIWNNSAVFGKVNIKYYSSCTSINFKN